MKQIFFAVMLVVVNISAQAQDNCERTPGHWNGFFVYKNKQDCQKTHGCKHNVNADVQYLKENHYLLTVMPEVGNGGQIMMTCQNGKVTSPVNIGNTIKLQCDKQTCFVHYRDKRLQAFFKK